MASSSLTVPIVDDDPPASPLQKIISRLPSSLSIKRVSLASPTSSPSPSHKRLRADSSILSSPDMRREVLVKKVKQKLSSSLVGTKMGGDSTLKLDDSVQIITDTNDNESLSLEERDVKTSQLVGEVNQNKNKPNDNIKPASEELIPNEAKQVQQPKASKSKKIEIKWTEVKRNKRKTRVFIFGSTVEGEKDEVIVEKAENNQKVPRVINGRRPYIVVPGVEYDLEEGEGVVMDTEEDETEIRLARNEKYEMDSFVCDTGYLSDEEMTETPSADKVISKVKQQRRANNIQAKLKFEKMGEPEVLGCLWWSGKGGQKLKMKKWQAIVFTSTPIATSFTTPIPEEPCSPLPALPSLPPPSLPVRPSSASPTVTDYATKYHIKYLVKNLVHKTMTMSVGGPNQCSTPMPGKQNLPQVPLSQSALVSKVVEQGDDILRDNKELLDRYVVKYFNKYKYQI